MHNAITFTPVEFFSVVLAICGALITISGAITVLAKWFNKAREPEEKQNQRIADIEAVLLKHDQMFQKYNEYFTRDKARLDKLEFGNEAVQEALLALLDHALNDNNTDGLKSAKKKLENFLIHQRTTDPEK